MFLWSLMRIENCDVKEISAIGRELFFMDIYSIPAIIETATLHY